MATREVGNLRTRLSWEDQGATRSLEGFRKDLKGLRSEMNLAKSGGKAYTNSLKGLREQSDILTRRFRTQEERVKELRKRYEESKRVKGEDAEQTKNLASQYNNAVAQMNRTENQLKKVNGAIEEQINPLKRLGTQLDSTGKKMQTIGRGMTDFGKSYTMGVTAPILAGGAAAFKASIDFESAFAGVEKTVDGSTEQIANLRQEIRDMAKDIPATTEQIAAVAESAGQLGIQTEKIESFTRTMIDLGEATNLTSEQAATEFARFANIVGMSQDDFDRLGSTIVDLGNNLATTESEISSLALRLAGAGKQVGLSEAQILAFAGALSSVGIEAEMGGSAFSKVMVNMQLATEKGGKSLENFAKVAGVSSKEFKQAYQEDATGAIISFLEGLSTAEERGLTAIGILDEMGIKEVRLRDTLLRAAGATDVFSNAIEIGSDAWEENTALTEEAEKRYETTESQLRIMWNRVKDVAISLGDSLAPAIMDAIDAVEPLIQKIEDGAQAFADMDEEQQQTILKLIGIAAAIGPVSVGLGGLTTTIGGLSRVAGGVSSLLGKVGGAGLLGRFAGLGMSGPVGLAVAGVGALGYGIYELSKSMESNIDETLNSIQTRKEEIDTIDQLIERFGSLQEKNKLSTDEMLRYMDIADELKEAKTEEAIKKLKDEQAGLLKKSGLTNKEMAHFLKLNESVVEKSSSTASAISEQGNAYAEVLSELEKLNEAEKQRLADDAFIAITDEMDKQKQNLKEQKELQQEIEAKERERQQNIKNTSNLAEQIKQKELEIVEIEKEKDRLTGEQRLKKAEQLVDEQMNLDMLKSQRDMYDEKIEKIENTISKKQTSLDKTNEELEAFDQLNSEYETIILSELDINAEKGQGIIAIGKQITELEKQKGALDKNSDEYNAQVKKIDNQIKKLQGAKAELENINKLAGQTIYQDRIVKYQARYEGFKGFISGDSSTVGLIGGGGHQRYATGTDYHPGGPFLAGEEGYELGRLGNRWEMLNLGMYNRPAGYQVFTHDETKNIIKALNQMPGYASGASPTGEANRIVNRLDQSQPQQIQGEAVIYTTVINQMDGREIGRHTHKSVTEFQNRADFIKHKFGGGST